jgi:transcriptional regulator GlxA family with amidase domain
MDAGTPDDRCNLESMRLARIQPTDRRLAYALEYALTHLEEEVTRTSLERAVGVSRRTLTCLFRETRQRTFGAWLRAIRMSRAVELLQEGAKVEVAMLAAGYHNKTNFNRTFRRHYGRNPGRWRGHSSPDTPSTLSGDATRD